ncbi:hypothetical protein GCM10020000_73090 [Streptomyces olivoverticillatus]
MRFGSLSESDEAVRAVLAERAGHYRERLAALDGRAEYNVKGAHREEEVLRRILAEEPEIRALNDARRAAGGGSYQDRLQFGERVARAVREREVRDARGVRERLGPLAEAQHDGPLGRPEPNLLNAAYLVPRSDGASFAALVGALAAAELEVTTELTGPWAPYSFVAEPDGEDPG